MNIIYGKVKDVVSQIGDENILGMQVFFVRHSTGISYLAKGRVCKVELKTDQDFKNVSGIEIQEACNPGFSQKLLSFEFVAVVGGAA